MMRRPPRSTQSRSSAASDVYKRQVIELTSLKRSENANDNVEMEFVVKSIAFNGKTYPVNSSVTAAQVEKVRNGDASNDGKKVVTGAVIGAIVGQIFGHHTKSTVILSLIHISEPTRLGMISYAVFCLK